MTHLLSISIGPVQPFIAAARRTADLSAGSDLLVKIATAVAISVRDQGGELIFPADPATDGPNKILAKVSSDPKAIAQTAQTAAQKVLADAWASALTAEVEPHVDDALADAQVKSFLEFYAAWVPVNDDNYPEARKQVELLLAGRKALRDFEQPTSTAGIRKSPLDPARDSVILDTMPRAKGPLFLKKAEHLDAVSLIKRVQGRGEGGVPSTSELSSVALRAQIGRDNPAAFDTLSAIAESTKKRLSVGDLLYPGRLKDAVEGGELTMVQGDKARTACEGKEPPDWASYYAILCADGDKMGKLLGEMTTPAKHIAFSRNLSAFAKAANGIVSSHGGHCVYSGGDDVVALLPTHKALDCAAELAKAFHAAVRGNLSVGVAIVHHMDPLQISLERAREAEREAKKERNSLAVALHTRGGEPRIVAEQWASDYKLTTWDKWEKAFRDKDGLSHGFPYELRHLAREAKGVLSADTLKAEADRAIHSEVASTSYVVVLSADTLKAEADRILKRKQGGTGNQPYLASLEEAIGKCCNADKLEALVAKLIICRFLAQYPEVS